MSVRIARIAIVALAVPFMVAAAKKPAAPKEKAPKAEKAEDPSGPSLKQSVAFLKEKIDTYGSYTYEVEKTDPPEAKGKVTGSAKLTSFDEKGCIIELRRQVALETTATGDAPSYYNEYSDIVVRIPLRDIDASKLSLDPLPTTFRKVYTATSQTDKYLQITFNAKEDKKPIKLTEKRKIDDGATTGKAATGNANELVGTTYILFSDADVAERAQKAAIHAVELCQKKKEVF